MKVYKLIDILSACDPNAEVVISSDSEGNQYHRVYGVCPDYILDEKEMEVYDLTLPPDEHCMDEDEWAEAIAKFTSCVVITP